MRRLTNSRYRVDKQQYIQSFMQKVAVYVQHNAQTGS